MIVSASSSVGVQFGSAEREWVRVCIVLLHTHTHSLACQSARITCTAGAAGGRRWLRWCQQQEPLSAGAKGHNNQVGFALWPLSDSRCRPTLARACGCDTCSPAFALNLGRWRARHTREREEIGRGVPPDCESHATWATKASPFVHETRTSPCVSAPIVVTSYAPCPPRCMHTLSCIATRTLCSWCDA